jgi:hypothetical protein
MVVAFAPPSSAVELRVEDTTGAPGEDVTVAVLIDDEGETLSAEFTLAYDRKILTAIGAETTSLTSAFIVAYASKWEQITVALGGDTAITGGKGALVKVTFSISEAAEEGETTLSISDAALYDANYQVKTVTTVGGTLTITSGSITTTTTTIGDQLCPLEVIYGEDSGEIKILRSLRNEVMDEIPEGQELIKLYYEWSPAIVKAMDEDERFKEDIKEMVNGLLMLFEDDEY